MTPDRSSRRVLREVERTRILRLGKAVQLRKLSWICRSADGRFAMRSYRPHKFTDCTFSGSEQTWVKNEWLYRDHGDPRRVLVSVVDQDVDVGGLI